MYQFGFGVPQDHTEAARLYRIPAELGNIFAQIQLGRMYDTGNGVPQDYREAVRWYRLASEQGDAGAQNNLALKYFYGEGVIQDYILAHMWSNIAAANGNADAHERREIIAKKMTPASVSVAQKRARQCVESNYSDCD